MNQSSENNLTLGIIYVLLASVFYAAVGTFVKLIGDGLPTSVIIFTRSIMCLLIFSPFWLKKETFTSLQNPTVLILRSVFALLALFSLCISVKYISLANALVLINASVIFLPIIAWIFRGARTPLLIWISIFIALIGIVFVIHPDKGIFQPASFIALFGGFCAGFNLLLTRLSAKKYKPNQVLFAYFFIGMIVTACVLPWTWKTPMGHQYWLLLGIAIAGVFYQLLITYSYKNAPVRLMGPLRLTTVIFGLVFDLLIFNIKPGFLSIIGIVIILVAAGFIAVYGGRKLTSSKTS